MSDRADNFKTETRKGFFESFVYKISAFLFPPPVTMRPRPSMEDLRGIAKEVIEDTGSDVFLQAYAATHDPEERQRLKSDWERRFAERKELRDQNLLRR